MIESAAGESIAAPSPWPARAANSVAALPAIAEAKEEAVKTPRPVRNTRPRPIRSAARPPRSKRLPNTRERGASHHQAFGQNSPADGRAAQLQVGGDLRQCDVHRSSAEDDHQMGSE